MRFSDMQKTIRFTSFCRGTSALLDSLSPSLCCLHPCHGKELWKVFQSCSKLHLFTQFLWSHLVAAVPVQNRGQLLFLANHRGAGEFLWILWLTENASESHPVFPNISNHILCVSVHNIASFDGTTGINVWSVNYKNRFKSLHFSISD